MRSVPYAMTWELFRSNGWGLLAGALGANVMPVLTFSALQRSGAIDHSADAGFVTMHVTFILINMFVFGVAAFGAFGTQGKLSRLYALPVRTADLVVWRLLPAMAAIVAQASMSIAALNAAFGLQWPIWGPAWFSAVAFGVVMVTFWLLEGSAWMPLGIGAVGTVLGLWFKSRYGGMFSMPSHLWSSMTPGDVATLCLGGVGVYFVGVFAVSRNRCGESLRATVTLNGLEWTAWSEPTVRRPFKSAAEAQLWYEWRRSGWILPGLVAVFGVIGLLVWAVFVRDPRDLVEGFAAGGSVLPIAALLCGFVIGQPLAKSERTDLGNFYATRPVTSARLAGSLLLLTARSVIVGWLVWGLPFAAIAGILRLRGEFVVPAALNDTGWWFAPIVLAAAWTLSTAAAALVLTGRSSLFAMAFTGIFACWATLIFLSTVVPPAIFGSLLTVLVVVIALVVLTGTAWAFQQAWRRRLAEPPALGIALALGLAGVAAAIGVSILTPVQSPLAAAIFLAGWSLLAVAPVATFPLALAWNRVR